MSAERLTVKLGERAYPLVVGRGLTGEIHRLVEKERQTAGGAGILVDAGFAEAQEDFLAAAFGELPRLEIPSGEGSKSFRQLERCCDFLATEGIGRDGCLFAVGGGVTGDLAGFAAAAWLRGIRFYQVPTTLLAMVDSSVGGKTGINLASGKNLVGAFHQPGAVFADVDVLASLPVREFSAGMAEVIKHALLGDAGLWQDLEQGKVLDSSSEALPAVIRRNCALKAEVVRADEREESASGGRALLNLGHTFGHAIEAVAGYGAYLHGEAVAVGLVLATRLAEKLSLMPPGSNQPVADLLRRYDLPVQLREGLPVEDLLAAARKDKKARAGRMRYVTLADFGKAVVVEGVEESLVRELWRESGASH